MKDETKNDGKTEAIKRDAQTIARLVARQMPEPTRHRPLGLDETD